LRLQIDVQVSVDGLFGCYTGSEGGEVVRSLVDDYGTGTMLSQAVKEGLDDVHAVYR
jgi:hypothetical protein